jgi:hypothetical protein
MSADHGNNRLAVLAGEIQQAHNDAVAASLTSIERGRAAGRGLIEAKSLVASGQWLAWLKTIGVNERTARDYMQLARLNDDEAIRDEKRDEGDPASEAEWTEDELDRKGRAEDGDCVLADMHGDEALIAWARDNDRFVRIDRASDWGNPFEIPNDGDRDEVILKFEKFYWPHKPALLEQVPALAGKVLACWCYPERCHGHVIAETANRVSAGDATAQQIADEIAYHDG